MARVLGHATARLLFLIVFVIYTVISVQLSAGFVLAIRSYDRGSIFRFKESMELLFYDQRKYHQTFPPPFVCPPDLPECQLVCHTPGQKEENEEAGMQGWCWSQAETGFLREIGAPNRRTRCLRRIPLVEVRCGDSGDRTPLSMSSQTFVAGVLQPARHCIPELVKSSPCSLVFAPVDGPVLSRISWRTSCDLVSCLRQIPLNATVNPYDIIHLPDLFVKCSFYC